MRTFVGIGDEALVESLAQLVGSHRRVMSEILAHLVEIESRRIHLRRGYDSLFVYCVKVLGFSEDEACRRVDAARIARKYPLVLSMVAEGSVTLSVLGLLYPRRKQPHFEELLSGVKGLTVRRAKEWLAARFPVADVPDRIRVLPKPGVARPVLADGMRGAGPPGRRDNVEPLSADRFSIRMSVSRRVRDKLELARDLVRHKHPSGALEDVLEMALDALIERVERAKFGKTERAGAARRGAAASVASPAQRRYVDRATRRETADRDGLRCAYVAPDGTRCTARAFLEFDHIDPVGLGRGSGAKKIRILCRPHNRLAAEDAYGAEYVAAAIEQSQAARTRLNETGLRESGP